MLHNPLVDQMQRRRQDRHTHAKFVFLNGLFIVTCLANLVYQLVK
jgi:hypothetical protein